MSRSFRLRCTSTPVPPDDGLPASASASASETVIVDMTTLLVVLRWCRPPSLEGGDPGRVPLIPSGLPCSNPEGSPSILLLLARPPAGAELTTSDDLSLSPRDRPLQRALLASSCVVTNSLVHADSPARVVAEEPGADNVLLDRGAWSMASALS